MDSLDEDDESPSLEANRAGGPRLDLSDEKSNSILSLGNNANSNKHYQKPTIGRTEQTMNATLSNTEPILYVSFVPDSSDTSSKTCRRYKSVYRTSLRENMYPHRTADSY